jgi:hypothetical protein
MNFNAQNFKICCVYIYVIIKFVTMWNDGQIVKDLSYGHGEEGSNFILGIIWMWL